MIEQKIGNIVDEVTAGIIIHQVNAQGYMNSGVAKAIRSKYPVVWDDYHAAVKPLQSDAEQLKLMGKIIKSQVTDDLTIISIVGQQFCGRDNLRYTSYDALDDGLSALNNMLITDSSEIHFPLIGCGLGGGHWSVVSALIETNLPSKKKTLWVLPD